MIFRAGVLFFEQGVVDEYAHFLVEGDKIPEWAQGRSLPLVEQRSSLVGIEVVGPMSAMTHAGHIEEQGECHHASAQMAWHVIELAVQLLGHRRHLVLQLGDGRVDVLDVLVELRQLGAALAVLLLLVSTGTSAARRLPGRWAGR